LRRSLSDVVAPSRTLPSTSSRLTHPCSVWLVQAISGHAHGTFADFSRKLLRLVHSSILSRVGASTKSGAVHCAYGWETGDDLGQASILVMHATICR
jgi:hypothetical protein